MVGLCYLIQFFSIIFSINFVQTHKIDLEFIDFQWLCKSKQYFSLSCSSEYLKCFKNGHKIKKCSYGQVWTIYGCFSPEKTICNNQPFGTSIINAITTKIINSVDFCHQKEGVYIANRKWNKCSKQAIVCWKNKAQVITCPKGQWLNEDFECWETDHCSRKDHKTMYPVAKKAIAEYCDHENSHAIDWHNACPYFHINCHKDEIVICDKGEFYDETQRKCVSLSHYANERPLRCFDETKCFEGSWKKRLPIDTCSSEYQFCYGNRGFIVNCDGKHQVFDDGTCREKQAVRECYKYDHSCADGTVSEKSSCDKYTICEHGKYEERHCGPYKTWSYYKNRCIKSDHCNGHDTYHDCTEDSTHQVNCHLYEQCEHGHYVLKDCGEKASWLHEYKKCVPDEQCNNNDKYQCHDHESNKNHHGHHKSHGKKESETCEYGETFADESSCNIYYECQHGKLVEKTCERNFGWDDDAQKCVRDQHCNDHHDVDGHGHGCRHGERVIDRNDCNSYQKCVHGRFFTAKCADYYAWNDLYKICVKDQHCRRKQWHAAEDDPEEIDKCVENELYEYNGKNQCNKYSHCFDGQLHELTCPAQYKFNPDTRLCIYDYLCDCCDQRQPDKQEKPLRKDCLVNEMAHKSCEKYYECENGQYSVKSCAQGQSFDRFQRICTADNTCHPENTDPNLECVSGSLTFSPNLEDCRFFYQCAHGHNELKACAVGTAWNQKILTCDHIENVKECTQ